MTLRIDNPQRPEVASLLREHLQDMHRHTPPDSVHALDTESLCSPDVTFWTLSRDSQLLGCGALLELDPEHGEIKSMRTVRERLRQGVGARILKHIIEEAQQRGYKRLSLETGSAEAYAPARALYSGFGFRPCPPFGNYRLDPNSVWMTLEL